MRMAEAERESIRGGSMNSSEATDHEEFASCGGMNALRVGMDAAAIASRSGWCRLGRSANAHARLPNLSGSN